MNSETILWAKQSL